MFCVFSLSNNQSDTSEDEGYKIIVINVMVNVIMVKARMKLYGKRFVAIVIRSLLRKLKRILKLLKNVKILMMV